MQRHRTIRRAGARWAGVLGLLAAGCATRGTLGPAAPGGTEKIAATASDTQVKRINLAVTARSGGGADDLAAASAVRDAVQGVMAAEGFVLNDGRPALRVDIRSEARPFDVSGEYARYEGSAEAIVERVRGAKLLGRQTFAVRGERKLGMAEARQAATEQLGREVAAWVAGACEPVRVELAANHIAIRRPWLSRNDPAYARMFVEKVSALDGVTSCELVEQDYDGRRMVFAVTFYRDAFPGGLLNRLAAIRELNLTPGN